MPTLTQLKYIVAVEKYRHFSKAAQACNVSQPSLSMQVKEAEEELGVVIFERDKKNVVPTEKGLVVIEQAQVVLREHERLLYLSQKEKGELKGTLKLAIIPTLAPYLLPLFLEQFATRYPKVRLQIDELKTDEIVTEIKGGALDAGLLVTPLNESQLIEKVLFYEPFLLFISKQHPLAKKDRISEEDLDGKDIWLLEEGHCLRNQVVHLCSLRSKPGVYKNVEFESGNLETLKQLVRLNRGYTLLPYLATIQNLDTESKKLLRPFKKPTPMREVSLVTRRGQIKSDILNALEAEILAALPAELRDKNRDDIEIVGI